MVSIPWHTKHRWNDLITRRLSAQLITIALATGIMDAATFPDMGVFCSNQTGNTSILALGIARAGPAWIRVDTTITSLCSFMLGAFLFGQFGNFVGCKKRWWLVTTNLLQTAFVVVSAALVMSDAVNLSTNEACVVTALLAFASGGQVAMARSVSTDVTTVHCAFIHNS